MTSRWRTLLHSLLVVVALLLAFASELHGSRSELPVQPPATVATPSPDVGVPPTPVSDSAPALARAERLLAAGLPDQATSALASALGAPEITSRLRARLLLARAFLAQGHYESALQLATSVAQRAPGSEEAGIAAAVAAQTLMALGHPGEAVEQLDVARTLLPEMAAYFDYFALEPLDAAGREQEAAARVERIVTTAPIRRLAVAALEWQRERATLRNDQATALATIDRLLELATIPSYRALLLLQRAELARSLGDRASAEANLVAAIAQAPDTSTAAQAIDRLEQLGLGDRVSPEQRGRAAFAAGRYAAAVEAFTAALDADPQRADLWYRRALARVRAGDINGGIADLLAMRERYPQDEGTPIALLTAGELLEWEAPERAAETYRELIARYPETDAVRQAQFRFGLLAYAAGDAAGALASWEPLAERDARAAFWLGKVRAVQGDVEGARAAWQHASELGGTGYYAQRARELLAGVQPIAGRPARLERLLPDPAPLETWFRTRGDTLEQARGRLAMSETIRRVRWLLFLGLREQAGWEIDVALDEFRADPAALVALAWELLEQGEAAAVYRIATTLLERGDVAPAALAPLLYPLPYPEALQSAADRFGVDPLLLAALVRQESGFEPSAVSPAGARGLTQVLPSTATGIAARLGLTNWNPDALFIPATSLLFGAAELAHRLEQYQGQLVLVLASYNAGAGAVDEWRAHLATSDPDLFAERIPYDETYAYVQRVYTNFRQYQALYN